jgi:hypothetical protein
MFGKRSFLTLMAIGSLAGAPALAAQAPGHPRPPAEWGRGRDLWGMRQERRGMRYGHRHVWLQRRGVHRFGRWDHRSRHFARQNRHRHWDGII